MTQFNDDDSTDVMNNRDQTQQRSELRDRIAIAAMQTYLGQGRFSALLIATDAYELADAMLEQRDKK